MTISQSNSPIQVVCSLGDDALILASAQWKERLGQPFQGHINFISEESSIDLESMIKQSISLKLDSRTDHALWFHGFVGRFEYTGELGRLHQYRATLVPTIELLRHSGGCRIFQEKSVPDIVKSIFELHGFSGMCESKLGQTYAKRDYCVQYGESDFHFVQRLLEEEGIYYFFSYDQGKHTLILADDLSAHQSISGYETVAYRSSIRDEQNEYATDYRMSTDFGTSIVVLNDYDFEKPRSPLLVKQKSPVQSHGTSEWFDYPGRFSALDDGQRLARLQMESIDSTRQRAHIGGNVRGVRAGSLVTLCDHPAASVNRQYLATQSVLHIEAPSLQVGDFHQFDCKAAIELLPTKTPFRPHRTIQRPVMRGPQVATVCGKSGEEIWTDTYGRIKVQFPWDRDGKADEHSSCWIRVSQAWTGKNWGAMSLPRIGDEVIVEFLDGDPDRPIVTGRVYNAERMPPESLASNQAKTIFRTRSTKAADATAFHELSFDDTKDKESILFHSERDFSRVVENDDVLKVGFEKKSPGDRNVEVYNNESIKIGLGSGNGSYTLEAAKSIILKCGGSQIEMTASSIKLTSTSITLKATGDLKGQGVNVAIQGDAGINLKGGANAALESGGNTIVKGALVNIN